jgi:glycosidase
LDSTWYHQEGFILGGDWESQHPLQSRHMGGDCIDLNTENQVVKDYLIGAINRYLDMGVDALRIDTVKHIERGNLFEYVNAWKAHKPGLFVFGENLVKGTGWGDLFGDDNAPSTIRPWWYTGGTRASVTSPVTPIRGATPASQCSTSASSPPSAII